jgi:hypothetical protein
MFGKARPLGERAKIHSAATASAVAAIIVTATVGTGCVSLPRVSAAHTGCAESEITISDVHQDWASRSWVATCRGRRFQCIGVDGGRDSAPHISCAAPSEPTPLASSGGASAPQTRETRGRAAQEPGVVRQVNGGITQLTAHANVGEFALMWSWTAGESEVAFAMLAPRTIAQRSCEVGLMIDGVRPPFPEPQFGGAGGLSGYRANISLETLRGMSVGARVVGRMCTSEWRLDQPAQAVVQELVNRIAEEGAWASDAPSDTETPANPGP